MPPAVSCSTKIHSPWLGDIDSDPQCELFFPLGIPGFEDQRRIIPVEIPAQRPLVYLQSADKPEICFVALPVFVIDSAFRLQISEEEMAVLKLPETPCPAIGTDVLCLALLAPSGRTVQTNLGATVVINLHNRCGVQCVPPPGNPAGVRVLADAGWVAPC